MQPVWLYKRLYLLWVWPKCFPDTFEITQWREFRNFFHFMLAFIFNTNDSFKWKIDHCPGMLTPHKEKYTASSTSKYAFIMTCAIFVFVVSWTWRLFVALSFHVYIHVYCHLCLIASATAVSLLNLPARFCLHLQVSMNLNHLFFKGICSDVTKLYFLQFLFTYITNLCFEVVLHSYLLFDLYL